MLDEGMLTEEEFGTYPTVTVRMAPSSSDSCFARAVKSARRSMIFGISFLDIQASHSTLQQELPAGMAIDRRIFRQSDFIEVAVDNVIEALRDGGLLVVVRGPNAGARLAQRILGVESAGALGMVAACVGLASNLAALRALATDMVPELDHDCGDGYEALDQG